MYDNNWKFTKEELELARQPYSTYNFTEGYRRNRDSLIDYHLGVYIKERLGYTLADIKDLGKRVHNLRFKHFNRWKRNDIPDVEHFYYKDELIFIVEDKTTGCVLTTCWKGE